MISDLCCIKCGKGVFADNIVLIRQNPKGESAVWACDSCNKSPVDKQVAEITTVIQADNASKQ